MEKLFDFIARSYPGIGRIQEFQPKNFKSVCNSHYILRTGQGQFVLKQMPDPREIFEDAESNRLEVIGRVVSLLQKSLPTEEIVPTNSGSFSLSWEGTGLRLFRWIEAQEFSYSPALVEKAFHLLRDFHNVDLKNPALWQELAHFSTPYALERTVNQLGAIENFLRSDPETQSLLETFPLIAKEAEKLVEQLPHYRQHPHLCHLDFHPKNLLVREGKLHLVDFDNLLVQSPLKCLAFALLRFGRFEANALGEAFTASFMGDFMDKMAPVYLQKPMTNEIRGSLLFWMKFLELEKSLRIFSRVMQTSKHRNYLVNVTNTHLPNFQLVREMCR